jgi:dCMP deaminase
MSEVKNFKVGQVWLSRSGEEFTIESVEGASGDFPIVAKSASGVFCSFTKYGSYLTGGLDLVTLVKDVPEETPESRFNDIYMQMAELMASQSKAIRKKVGAVLVTNNGVVLTGYNGTPSGWDNTCEHKTEDGLVTKPETIHAELNCILKAAKQGVSVIGSSVYVTLSPCSQCAAMLAQAGVKAVYYREQYRDKSGVSLLEKHGIMTQQI